MVYMWHAFGQINENVCVGVQLKDSNTHYRNQGVGLPPPAPRWHSQDPIRPNHGSTTDTHKWESKNKISAFFVNV